MRCAITHRLEGSRFGACPADLATFATTLMPLKPMKTCGSRKRLNAMHSLMAFGSFTPGQWSCTALGNSREPPALTLCGLTTPWHE